MGLSMWKTRVVYVHAKWFFVKRERHHIWTLQQESLHPDRSTVPNSQIEKVMFLAAVGVPQIRPDDTYFDVKLVFGQ